MEAHQTIPVQAQLSAFSEQADDVIAPAYAEDPLFLLDPDDAFKGLREIDWSFEDDDTRFLGHDLHPYPAKFIPQIPGNLISRLSVRGDLVMDPFGGSGTTALEAVRLGRRAVSVDANPVASLIGRVKTAKVNQAISNELRALHGSLRTELGVLPDKADVLPRRYGHYAPEFTNREKWFPDTSFGELSLIKYKINLLESGVARDIALLALSRTILPVSFQDSETRYKSVPRSIPVGVTVRRYLREFESVMMSVARNEPATRYGISRFISADIRTISDDAVGNSSVDLIVSSPPYGNATDYHLYHRFRLLWLGYDPSDLASIEIGSHLKHQREDSGFSSYFADMELAVHTMERVLRPGRYAALVIGNSVYKGEEYDTASLLAEEAEKFGFDCAEIIERPVHKTKRSFTPAGRRATCEKILVMRKRERRSAIRLESPPYKMWPYERILRLRECAAASDVVHDGSPNGHLPMTAGVNDIVRYRRLVFTHCITGDDQAPIPTWQSIIENGMASNPSARKDPKYVTHGLHAYKGKFYPQLAKGLLNIVSLHEGAHVLDPFCGSGTTLLEGYLNGLRTYGCDMNPIAAKIARAKTAILDVDPDLLTEVVAAIIDAIECAPRHLSDVLTEFPDPCKDEIARWFPFPVAKKLNWLLRQIRKASAGVVTDFLEVVFSSIIRDVSQQEPSDLRVRYRKNLIDDADVFGLFASQLLTQFGRIEKFWRVRGYSPNRFFSAHVVEGDNRKISTYEKVGLRPGSVDLVLTSPPYATALPYIDTDRLSLLTIFGLSSTCRRPLENGLIGSRELSASEKRDLEESSEYVSALPDDCIKSYRKLSRQVDKDKDVGFRRRNAPALLLRFMSDMQKTLQHVYCVCKPGAEAMIVIGDNRIELGGRSVRIPTTDLVESIAAAIGYENIERIDISVTTENLLHIRNAITENVVLRLRKPAM